MTTPERLSCENMDLQYSKTVHIFNPFTPMSDEVASVIHFSIKGWEIILFELGSERVKWSIVPPVDHP